MEAVRRIEIQSRWLRFRLNVEGRVCIALHADRHGSGRVMAIFPLHGFSSPPAHAVATRGGSVYFGSDVDVETFTFTNTVKVAAPAGRALRWRTHDEKAYRLPTPR